jgi:4-hydroxybenzoate polyprenyltransferase
MASSPLPDPKLLALFAIGAVLMRGAGCIVNDIYDREIDRLVERTKNRPLASGELGLGQAFMLLGLALLLSSIVLFQFNHFTQALAIGSLSLVFTYPLAKRVTWWPQLVLGFAFNWGALVGWSSVQATLSGPAILLYIGGVFWTLAYDTMYAHQDKRDDMLVGVKSLALKLGKRSKIGVGLFMAMALAFMIAAGYVADESFGFYVLMIAACAHAGWQTHGWDMDDGANCARRFRSNRDFGLIVFAAIVAGKLI